MEREELEAQLTAALDFATSMMTADLKALEEALGVEIEPGAFALGMFVSTFVMSGRDVVERAKQHPEPFRGLLAKARAAAHR